MKVKKNFKPIFDAVNFNKQKQTMNFSFRKTRTENQTIKIAFRSIDILNE